MFSSRRYLHAPWHGSFQDASQLRWLLLQASNIHKILQLRLLCVNAVHHLWWWNTSCRTVNRPTRSWEQKLGLLTHWRWRSTTLWRTPNISRHSSEPLERTTTTTLLPAMPSASSLRVPSLPPFIHLSSFCLLLTFPHSFSLFSSSSLCFVHFLPFLFLLPLTLPPLYMHSNALLSGQSSFRPSLPRLSLCVGRLAENPPWAGHFSLLCHTPWGIFRALRCLPATTFIGPSSYDQDPTAFIWHLHAC